jgi:uncharacterized protein (TIGR02145 family)
MTENLRVTKYNDGSPIPFDTATVNWRQDTTPKFCFHRSTTNSYIKKYGALYNWYVVNPRNPKKVAPTGWHVPTDSEWTVMEKYLVLNGYNWDGSTTANKIAKSLAAMTDWYTFSTTGTISYDFTLNNRSGFSALPGGGRDSVYFIGQSYNGLWWSATEEKSLACFRGLGYCIDDIYRKVGYKDCCYSVRLVRD